MAGDKLRDAVERNTNEQRLELISKDLDKPQLSRPSSDQYMREQGYPNRSDVPKELRTQYAKGGIVKGVRHYACKTISCTK
jgi:hypothetical protein